MWAGAALLDTMFWAIVAGGLIRVQADRGRRSAARLCTLNSGRRHGIVLAALSETVLEVLMRLLQVLAKLRRAVPACGCTVKRW